jgi:predicted metal-dependent peptidase
MKKIQDAGLLNDWKRMRRRWLAATPRQYLPKRHTHKPRWLAMLDTSGSMSQDDLIYAVSQLKALGNTEGYIICCDASPDWKSITKISHVNDLKHTKIVGRGGTIFDEFFRDYAKNVGNEWDCVIVLTDGYCGTVPLELKPRGVDVVWVLTNYQPDWKQPFGRKAPLRINRQ